MRNSDMNGKVREYVRNPEYRKALGLPDAVCEEYVPLAQGEYNVNYLFRHPADGRRLVLRINAGSQMHLDRQIEYEAHALKLLGGSGRTPALIFTDGSGRYIDNGVLVMEYLPGRYPSYDDRADMDSVMECMADIHSVQIPSDEVIWGEPGDVPRDTVRLIAPADPAEAILDECEEMVRTYMDSPLGSDEVKARLRAMLDRGHEIADSGQQAGSCRGDAYRCCINTELNSTNFLIDGGRASLVDWEKPLYGDPAQDLGHLLAPTTTFWKTDVILTQKETDRLMDEYIRAVRNRFDTAGIRERTQRLIKITCLRGLTWCAMAWVQYKDPGKAIVNESTRVKLDAYLSGDFLSDIEQRLGL